MLTFNAILRHEGIDPKQVQRIGKTKIHFNEMCRRDGWTHPLRGGGRVSDVEWL